MKHVIFSLPMALSTGLLLIGCSDERAGTCEGPGTCDCLKGEASEPAVIRVENQTSAPVILPTACQSGPSVIIDDDSRPLIHDSVLNSWSRYSCDDVLANRCRENECHLDDSWIEIGPGEAYEQSWSGHLLTEEPIDVPDECNPDCMRLGYPEVFECRRRVAPAPGTYTVTVRYQLLLADPIHESAATFTWPTTKVTVAIP